jgi:hypothetical protein
VIRRCVRWCGRSFGLTGMNVQRLRMKEILFELKRRGVFTVVGGPWFSRNLNQFTRL